MVEVNRAHSATGPETRSLSGAASLAETPSLTEAASLAAARLDVPGRRRVGSR